MTERALEMQLIELGEERGAPAADGTGGVVTRHGNLVNMFFGLVMYFTSESGLYEVGSSRALT